MKDDGHMPPDSDFISMERTSMKNNDCMTPDSDFIIMERTPMKDDDRTPPDIKLVDRTPKNDAPHAPGF